MTTADLFDAVVDLPDPDGQQEYDRLVGLDDVKHHLVKESALLVDPALLNQWSTAKHGRVLKATEYFRRRPPLFVLAGDVGTGKSALARSFGNEVARRSKVQVQLYSLSLNARGSGTVGEMTTLISSAFSQVCEAVKRSRGADSRSARAIILVIDEADALAQSREMSQMHHEDRAGVNALIRGIDEIANRQLPVVVVMCTNRLDAIDPAVQRRAAATFVFSRPDAPQRREVLRAALGDCSITDVELTKLVEVTGEQISRPYGYTYSDITQRLVPRVILAAFPDRAVDGTLALSVAAKMKPTPPFATAQGEMEAGTCGSR